MPVAPTDEGTTLLMDARMRAALAVGGGYLLGRTKKLKFALTVGSMVAGRKGANGLLGQGIDLFRESPEFDRLRGQLAGAGRSAALSAAAGSLGRLTDRIEYGKDNDSDEDEADEEQGAEDAADDQNEGDEAEGDEAEDDDTEDDETEDDETEDDEAEDDEAEDDEAEDDEAEDDE